VVDWRIGNSVYYLTPRMIIESVVLVCGSEAS